jgi:hypothetical protein
MKVRSPTRSPLEWLKIGTLLPDVKISDVKKKLLAKEHSNAAQAGADASLMEITATSLIIAALDIEVLQYVHHCDRPRVPDLKYSGET